MKPACLQPVRVIAALVLAVVALGGCDDDENEAPKEGESQDARVATEATKQIPQEAPTVLLGTIPDELLQVTVGGMKHDIRDLLTRPSDTRPSAHIVAAYQTVNTPPEPPPFGTSSAAVTPDYTHSAPAAQVYECRELGGNFAWAFLQPEAGLQPITTRPISGLEKLTLDHFRYPGGIDYGPPTGTPPVGPAWRVAAPALDQGTPTSGQSLFIGAVDVSVPHTGSIPLLRLVNVARIDQGLPAEVFSRTASDGTQTGYVFRLNTLGGLSPGAGCSSAADVGKRERVPYSAEYYFIDVLTAP